MHFPSRTATFILLAAVTASLGALTSAAGEEFQLEPEFTRLDNGENLDGWNGRKEGWSVVDGAIHLDLHHAKGHLYSNQTHSRNCVIRLQFRATPRGDAGVLVWGAPFPLRDFLAIGPKIYVAAAKPAGEWNDLEIDMTHGTAVVSLNGKFIDTWKIGEQSKKGVGLMRKRGDFDFRYIRIMEK
jgi:hypothetical protein